VLQKSSAIYLVPRVFAQKGFAIFGFWTYFFVHFLKFFWLLCKVIWKNNKINLQVLIL
jgi:hypothetical protein